MSMTVEEAIEILENGGWWESLIPVTTMKGRDEEEKLYEAVFLAISALRPVSREKVEKMRGEWTGIFYAHCSRCGEFSTMAYIGQGGNFCPRCGAPMTDEAVDMVMERLEEVISE